MHPALKPMGVQRDTTFLKDTTTLLPEGCSSRNSTWSEKKDELTPHQTTKTVTEKLTRKKKKY